MRDTAIALLESSMIPSVDVLTANTLNFNRLRKVSEAAEQRLGYVPQKVVVCESPDYAGSYMIEFTGNLERLMKDQVLDLNEAVTAVAEANNISTVDCTVVFDEAALNKINLNGIIAADNIEFSLARI